MSDAQSAAEAVSNDPAESRSATQPKVQDTAPTSAPSTSLPDVISATGDAPSTDKETSTVDVQPVKADGDGANRDRNRVRHQKANHNREYKPGNRYKGDWGSKKGEFDNLEESDDPVAIRAQAEFYFSDKNLSTDQHLFLKIEGPRNRPVTIKHIHTFKRMRHFQPYSAVVDALRQSETLVVVDDGHFYGFGNEGVQRKDALIVPHYDSDVQNPPSLPEQYQRMHHLALNEMDSSIYAKGFAMGENEVGQIALEDFFKPYGAVLVRKRRDKETNAFKGSVFVEFDTEESQQQFLALENKPTFDGKDLKIMSKRGYSEMKCEEKGIIPDWKLTAEQRERRRLQREKRAARGNYRGGGDYRGRGGNYTGRGDHRGPRGGRWTQKRGGNGGQRGGGRRNNDNWNQRREHDQNSPKEGDEKEDNNTSKKRKADDDNDAEPTKKTKLELKQDE